MLPGPNEDDLKHVSLEYLHNNLKQIDVARTFLSIVAGIVAGVLGCKNGSGLICFITLYGLIGLTIALRMNLDVKTYTNQSAILFATGDLQKNGLSFVLFWTLTYALVYIY